MKTLIGFEEIEDKIITLRGQKVLLDRDVATLYGVETKRVNEALRNNLDKFPKDYCFTLQVSEKQYLVENFDRFSVLKHSTVEPKAFTEKGLLYACYHSEKFSCYKCNVCDYRDFCQTARTLPYLEQPAGCFRRAAEILVGEKR